METPIVAMAVMPNHWHFVVRPNTDEQVSDLFRRLSVMHTMRYHAHDKTAGTGHLYQGRFKSFPIQCDEHLLTGMRYGERNPVRANFVDQAEDWRWGSAHARQQPADQRLWLATPSDPPLPRQWRSWVNKPQTDAEVKALRACIQRGVPFGDDRWIKSSTVRLSLESTTRPRGRPRKKSCPLFSGVLVNRTAQTERVVDVKGLKQDMWDEATVDFKGPKMGDRIDEMQWLLPPGAELLIDDVTLYIIADLPTRHPSR